MPVPKGSRFRRGGSPLFVGDRVFRPGHTGEAVNPKRTTDKSAILNDKAAYALTGKHE